jgi:hypothetical protein
MGWWKMGIWKLKDVRGNTENKEYALCVVNKKVGVTYLDVMRQKAGGMI